MSKKLNLQEVEKWLAEHGITMYKINRELSDAVIVATLIKKYYPKYVEMHSYPVRSNTQLKLVNWVTLNKNVLSKLGISRPTQALEKLAQASPGAIEALIWDIMQLEEIARIKRDKELQEFKESSQVVVVELSKKVNGVLVPINEKMIRYSMYEDVLKESQAKDMALKAAETKLKEMEKLAKQRGLVLPK